MERIEKKAYILALLDPNIAKKLLDHLPYNLIQSVPKVILNVSTNNGQAYSLVKSFFEFSGFDLKKEKWIDELNYQAQKDPKTFSLHLQNFKN